MQRRHPLIALTLLLPLSGCSTLMTPDRSPSGDGPWKTERVEASSSKASSAGGTPWPRRSQPAPRRSTQRAGPDGAWSLQPLGERQSGGDSAGDDDFLSTVAAIERAAQGVGDETRKARLLHRLMQQEVERIEQERASSLSNVDARTERQKARLEAEAATDKRAIRSQYEERLARVQRAAENAIARLTDGRGVAPSEPPMAATVQMGEVQLAAPDLPAPTATSPVSQQSSSGNAPEGSARASQGQGASSAGGGDPEPSRWAVSLLFSDRAAMQEAARSLSRNGFADQQQTAQPDSRRYRLYLGVFNERGDAERHQARVDAQTAYAPDIHPL